MCGANAAYKFISKPHSHNVLIIVHSIQNSECHIIVSAPSSSSGSSNSIIVHMISFGMRISIENVADVHVHSIGINGNGGDETWSDDKEASGRAIYFATCHCDWEYISICTVCIACVVFTEWYTLSWIIVRRTAWWKRLLLSPFTCINVCVFSYANICWSLAPMQSPKMPYIFIRNACGILYNRCPLRCITYTQYTHIYVLYMSEGATSAWY